MRHTIFWPDLFNIFSDEWESTNILFRIILVITQPIRYLISGLIFVAVLAYIFSGFGFFIILQSFIEGPIWLGWIVLIFDIALCVAWAYAKVTENI